MTNAFRWDPFEELRSTMDQLFDQGFSRPWRFLATQNNQAAFPVDLWETDDAIEILAQVPGVRPEDVDIAVTSDVLTIKAEHPQDQSATNRSYLRQEIPYGSSTRSFNLPMAVEPDKAEARYEYGMLYLRLPKAESVRPRQIKVTPVQNGAAQLTS